MNPTKLLPWLLVAALATSTGLLPAGDRPAARVEPKWPAVVRAEPAPEWNARFAGKEGWIGGDGVYSVVLARDRILWLFGDSLLGTARNGRRDGAVMVNNT